MCRKEITEKIKETTNGISIIRTVHHQSHTAFFWRVPKNRDPITEIPEKRIYVLHLYHTASLLCLLLIIVRRDTSIPSADSIHPVWTSSPRCFGLRWQSPAGHRFEFPGKPAQTVCHTTARYP